MKATVMKRTLELYTTRVLRRTDLISQGLSGREITAAVSEGRLLRLRRDHYAAADLDPQLAAAVRAGGRLSCLSLLQMIGIFVQVCDALHVHMDPGASRLPPCAPNMLRHWSAWSGDRSHAHVVPVLDAVLQSVRCQQPRAALATLDSVVHHKLISVKELHDAFRLLPARFRPLLALIDGSAESGPETYMRLILRVLGVPFQAQVIIAGVGRVDFVVDGWLIIECDSREFHSNWEQQLKDRRRDMIAASLGYLTVRPVASDIMHEPARVRALIQATIACFGARFKPARRA